MAKIYRTHHCGAQHKSYLAAAKCIFRKSTSYIDGDGAYACVNVHSTSGRRWGERVVHLFTTLEDAYTESQRPWSGSQRGTDVIIIAPLDQLVQCDCHA